MNCLCVYKIYPGQRNAVKMTFDFHFSPPNTVIGNHKLC